VFNALVPALDAGYQCTALVRTPQKLKDMLAGKVSEEVQSKHLTIVQGNNHDGTVVKEALTKANGRLHPIIISGIGSYPSFKNPFMPTLEDPHVCEKAIVAIKEVLKENQSTERPVILFLSTTGTGSKVRDVPYLMMSLYYWVLPVPHADKHKSEEAIKAAKEDGLIRDYVILRCSLFSGSEGGDYSKLRAGYEERKSSGADDRWNKQDGIAMGYTITKDVVGRFMYEEGIARAGQSDWEGKCVTITL